MCGDSTNQEDVSKLLGGDTPIIMVTDPPYGVDLEAKRSKQRGGGVSVREGSYSIPDTPEYVSSVVVPVIEQCRSKARCPNHMDSTSRSSSTRTSWFARRCYHRCHW